MCCDIYVWRGGREEIYFKFIIIIKMASVFKLPDVNVNVCVWRVGGGGGYEIKYLLY